jgi:hypothetical protein
MTTKIILTQLTTSAGLPIELKTDNSLTANAGSVPAVENTISPFLLAGM